MYSMGSSHQSTQLCAISAGKENTAGGSAMLMELLTCVGLGRLLTKTLRTLFFTILFCVDFRPLT